MNRGEAKLTPEAKSFHINQLVRVSLVKQGLDCRLSTFNHTQIWRIFDLLDSRKTSREENSER